MDQASLFVKWHQKCAMSCIQCVVYHLNRKIGSSSICANGKQKCLMASSVRISHLPFTHKTPVKQYFKLIKIPRWRWGNFTTVVLGNLTVHQQSWFLVWKCFNTSFQCLLNQVVVVFVPICFIFNKYANFQGELVGAVMVSYKYIRYLFMKLKVCKLGFRRKASCLMKSWSVWQDNLPYSPTAKHFSLKSLSHHCHFSFDCL